MTPALDTYAELLLAEGKLLRWGARETKCLCALQPRDLEILVALARYRFLTTGQIAELWWNGKGLRAVRRRMTRLFEAGFVDRFRPQTLRGSYQWTYCLARDGFRAAEQTGELPCGLKFAPRRESPDALLDVAAADGDARVFVEYDRTRRVDKNYDKFLRYETLLTVWWRATSLGCPFVVFVCQDADHRRRFVYAADVELTGRLSAWTEAGHEERYCARDRTLFVLESDIRDGDGTAMLLPELPPRHERRSNPATVRRVALPGLED